MTSTDSTESDDDDNDHSHNGGDNGSRKRQQADDNDDDEDPPAPAVGVAKKRRLVVSSRKDDGASGSSCSSGDEDLTKAGASSTAVAVADLKDSNTVVLSETTASVVEKISSQQHQEPEEEGSKTISSEASDDVPMAASSNKDRNNENDKARPMKAESHSGEAELPSLGDGDHIYASSASADESVNNNNNDPCVEGVSSHAGDVNSDKDPNSSSSTTTTNSSDDPYEKLRWITVRNDGRPESMIKLIGLKSLFAKQLPKMPRAYIARLVLDRRHTSLAIVSDNPALKDSDEEIIGGICYRAFEKERFAEIAFCAVNASHQVKGYGTKLMNLLKQTGARTGIEFFITYADNYAIGYFKKQGFTKSISMPKGRYQGLIKDYDGGTPMECYVHPSVDYFHVPAMIQQQRAFLLHRIARTARSATTIYPPLTTTTWSTTTTATPSSSSRAYGAAAKALAVPGVAQAGWTLPDLASSSSSSSSNSNGGSATAAAGGGSDGGAVPPKQSLKQDLLALVKRVEEQQFAWPFREPVDTNEVPDYLDVITEPIDLRTIEKRIQNSNHYKNRHMLLADLQLMVDNCKTYNEDGSTYTQCAEALENFVHQLFGPTTMMMTGQGESKNTTSSAAGTTAGT